jgi:repressor LexA
MIKKITETQQNVLKGITKFIEERGYPPTIREIMEMFGYASVNNVQRILTVLENKGYIKRELRGGARCIEVVKDHKENQYGVQRLPLLGQISAGEPIFADQNVEGFFSIDTGLLGKSGDFLLRVSGNSMQGANIFDNDLIVVKRANTPKNNDIIVALLDDEATVKRYFLESNTIRLQPENPDYDPIILDKNDMYFKMLGRVEAVFHRF